MGQVRKAKQSALPVSEAIQSFLHDVHQRVIARQLSPVTEANYRGFLGTFARWCERQRPPVWLHQVDKDVLAQFLEYIQTTSKPARADHTQIAIGTLDTYARYILVFLKWCLDDDEYAEHVQERTIRKIKRPKLEEEVIETFSSEQIAALFAACDLEESEHLQLRNRAILAVLLDTGIRAKELVTLSLDMIDLNPQDPHIRVHGKGNKWGEIGLGEQSRRLVARYIRLFRQPAFGEIPLTQLGRQRRRAEVVFVNRNGRPITPKGLWEIIERLGMRAEIDGVRCSPHTFRHTFAKLFMQNGGDIYRLSKLLRHSSVAVTERYLRSLRQSEARKEAPSVLDELSIAREKKMHTQRRRSVF